MSDSDTGVAEAEAPAAPPAKSAPAKPKASPEDRPKVDRLPPYHVVLLNDDDHTVEYVIDMLRKVFGLPLPQAIKLTWAVDRQGKAVVWTGSKEVAELKREQVRSFGPDFFASATVRYPLGCVIQPGT